jgi:hypothetical protein
MEFLAAGNHYHVCAILSGDISQVVDRMVFCGAAAVRLVNLFTILGSLAIVSNLNFLAIIVQTGR